MVQFIPAPQPLAGLKQGLGDVGDVLGQIMQRRRAGKERETESQALSEAGFNVPSGIVNPKIREKLLEGQLKNKSSVGDIEKDTERRQTLAKYFGPNVAELYGSLTEGGKTQLSNIAVESLHRGQSFEDVLKEKLLTKPQEVQEILQEIQNPQKEVIEEESISPLPGKKSVPKEEIKYPKIEVPQNKTPKELQAYQKDIRKENVPVFQKAKDKIKGLQTQEDHLKVLESLTDKIPDITRFMINKNGQLRPIAQMLGLVPKEAQRFVKTVKDFITGAKEIFGSRVTNFDIQAFEARLPSLLNTKDGRKEILEQMNIFTEIEKNYNEALKNIYKHYKLDNISQEQAEDLAEKMVAPKEKELREKLNKIGAPSIPEGRVAVEINGKRGHVPAEQVDLILQRGGKKI